MQQNLLRSAAALGLAVLCAIMLSGTRLSGQNSASDAAAGWEHLALTDDLKKDAADEEVGRRINRLGREGWQLVDVEGISENGTTAKTVYYFKREL